MEKLDSLIPGMSEEAYYAKAALRQSWRMATLPEKVSRVVEMQARAAVLMRLRGKNITVWQDKETHSEN